MQVGERWMRWTLAEAGTKTSTKLLQKVVGVTASSWINAVFATTVISIVQVLVGLSVVTRQGKSLFPGVSQVTLSCAFGFVAFVMTTLSFVVFVFNGDIGVNTFIITLSIVPGAIIDRVFFGHKLNFRQWMGVLMAIFAGYAVLDFPSLSQAFKSPTWVWLSLATALLAAVNQGITQKNKAVDPFVKNFWGGLTTLISGVVSLLIVGSLSVFTDFSVSMQKIWLISALMGFIIVGMWSFNLLSYKGGASIALKKLVMNGSYLVTAMLGGVLIFNESLTAGKVSGIFFFIAFTLMDKGTWEFVRKSLGRKNEPANVV